MLSRIAMALAISGCLLAAPAARAADVTGSSVTIEAFGGWQDLQLSASSVANAVKGSEGTALVGGDLLFKSGLFGVGVAVDKTLGGTVNPWDGSIMLGLVFDLIPSLRLEALGEVGRRGADIGDWFSSSGQTFLGLRPGVSFRLVPLPLRFGVTGLVRWPTSGSSFGSPDYGILGKVGLEFP